MDSASKTLIERTWALCLILSLFAASCNKTDEPESPVQEESDSVISLSNFGITADCNENNAVVTFTSSMPWTASCDVSWIKIDISGGSAGESTINARIARNPTYDQRNGAITIKAKGASSRITITQKQQDALLISSNKIEVPAQGDTRTLEVRANVPFNVTVDEDCGSWISILETKSLATYNILLQIAENESLEKREGFISIESGGKTEKVTIYQQGAEPRIVLSRNLIEVGEEGGDVQVELQSNVDYDLIMPDVDWIARTDTRAMSSYTHHFTVSDNDEYEQREADIKFVNRADGKSETVTIRQKPKSSRLSGKWYLGWWVSGSTALHFNGNESISFNGNALTWSGQMDTNGNGVYQIEYAADMNSFVMKKTGVSTKFLILLVSDNLLILQENNETGPKRYWYPSAQEAISAPDPTQSGDDDDSGIPNPSHTELGNVDDILALKQGITDSNITPMGRHFVNAHKTTAEDIQWLLNPENEPDYYYANENVASPTLTVWKEFPVELYPFGSPEPADVNQHAIGDCSFCAVMASVAYLFPGFIKDMINDNGDGTYTVRLYDPEAKAVNVCVKSTFLCNKSGSLAQVTGKNNVVTWSTVLEKAVMKYETIYKVDRLYGIGSEFVAPVLTGDGRSFSYSANALWNNELRLIANWSVDEGMIGIGGFTTPNLQCGQLYTVTAHAFTIMKTSHESEGYLFSMRNPWGIESVDGVLDIPNTRKVCSTIDFRIIYPGAALPYLRKDRGAYVPPVWTAGSVELGVSHRLLQATDCQSVRPSPYYN